MKRIMQTQRALLLALLFVGAGGLAFGLTQITARTVLSAPRARMLTAPHQASPTSIATVQPARHRTNATRFPGSVRSSAFACPAVIALSPTSGAVGAIVSLTGTGFTDVTAVTFSGNVAAANPVITDEQIIVAVPPGATTGPLTLSKASCANVTTTSFTVTTATACPTLTALSPASGAIGSTVTLSGANFAPLGFLSVKFTGNVAATVLTQTSSTLTVNVPSGATSGPLTLSQTGCSDLSTSSFTINGGCPVITVNPSTTLLTTGLTGTAYNQTFTQSGGTGTASFSVSAGTLPTGLTLSSAGVLSGTPTSAGYFTFTVRATDANSCTGERQYNVRICPVITLSPTSLPSGTVSTAYSQTLTASAGFAPFSFTLSAGALPSGLTLSTGGVLSGTPTQSGTFTPTFLVTDGNGCTGSASYALVINATSTLTRAKKADFDGDGKTDLSVWRGSTGTWSALNSSTNTVQSLAWGASYAPYYDVIVPGDYDGDGKTDQAIWRGQDSLWYIRKSSDGQPLLQQWGANYAPYNDVPVPGDYDGDGKTDIAVWRATTATWYVLKSSDGAYLITAWGAADDTPVPGDYDGDGKTDFAVWRGAQGTWHISYSGGGSTVLSWGAGYAPYYDVPVAADYDGDGKTDLAIWRGADSIWYIRPSATPNSPVLSSWGANYAPYNDVPVPGDYDGDGKADIAVWRATTATWYVLKSSDGAYFIEALGANGDTPVPARQY